MHSCERAVIRATAVICNLSDMNPYNEAVHHYVRYPTDQNGNRITIMERLFP